MLFISLKLIQTDKSELSWQQLPLQLVQAVGAPVLGPGGGSLPELGEQQPQPRPAQAAQRVRRHLGSRHGALPLRCPPRKRRRRAAFRGGASGAGGLRGVWACGARGGVMCGDMGLRGIREEDVGVCEVGVWV